MSSNVPQKLVSSFENAHRNVCTVYTQGGHTVTQVWIVDEPTLEKWRHFISIFRTFCPITSHIAKSSTRGYQVPSHCYILECNHTHHGGAVGD